MVRVGIVGVGFMGWIHWLAYERIEGMDVAAICSRDPRKRSGDWSAIQGNFGPPGRQVELTDVQAYAELDQLLADPSIDLVDICLPPAQHGEATIAALKAGKHVLCEKPMALDDKICRKMVAAAEKAGRFLLVGHVLPMFPEYAFVQSAATDRRYGELLGGYFKRVISDPTWLSDFYDPEKVGGPLLDLHVHDAHFIRMLFGMPTSVSSAGRMRGETVEYCHTLFHYPDQNVAVAASSGVIRQQGRAFTHGFEVHFQQATMQFESAVIGSQNEVLMPLTVLTADGQVHRPELSGGDPIEAFVAELQEVKRSLTAGEPSPILGAQLARDAIRLCQKQTSAVQKRRLTRV